MNQSKDFPDCFYRVTIKALIRDGNKFLLGHLKNSLWETLGGGLDFGESPHDALRREITEETGCTVLSIAPQPALVLNNKVLNKRDMEWYYNFPVYYETQIDIAGFNPDLDFSELKWVSVDELQTLPLFQGEEGIREGFKALIK